MSEPSANALRYQPGSPGHVESYFMRGNAPDRRLAFWLKATVFAPRPGSAVAELWCIFFDIENQRTWAEKTTVPFAHASFQGDPTRVTLAGAEFLLSPEGHAKGALEGSGGPCSWDITWRAADGPIGQELCLLPSKKMIDGAFPRSTPLTPYPVLHLDGTFQVFGEEISLKGWTGMQGHNWGREHAFEYGWGQCVFLDDSNNPCCWVEGFSGKIRMAGKTSPFFSSLVVRRGDREYRFDRLLDFWRQKPSVKLENYSWNLRLQSSDGEVALAMDANPDEMVCLGYHNPDGRLSYCLNSKLARVHLRVNPVNEAAFECKSEHGGALEFLRNTPDPHFTRVV